MYISHSRTMAASLVTALALQGCVSTGNRPTALHTLPLQTKPVDTVRPTGSATGTLVNVNGCLRIERGPRQSSLVVWPHGTRLSPDGRAGVTLPDGRSIAVGQRVTLGGGERPDLPSDLVAVPPHSSCTGPYFVAASLSS